MNRIAILTGGGDAPGLNAVIRAVVKTAIGEYGWDVLGVRNGFDGFVSQGGVFPLSINEVRGILQRGGTILGTANRGNPFARKVMKDGVEIVEDTSQQVYDRIRSLGLDALIVVGGDGTLGIARDLHDIGVPVVGVPKTIDNDVSCTDFTFGFDTAVVTATEAIDKLHTTAESHHRVMVVELMGRDAGFITLYAGIAGGADVILIPEIPFRFEAVCAKVQHRIMRGSFFSIIAVAEGAHPLGGEQVVARQGDAVYIQRLGGISQQVADFVSLNCQVETRVTVLGHLQRGGSPTPFDRWLATRLGTAAVRAVANAELGKMVAMRGDNMVMVPLTEVLAQPKRVDIDGDAVRTARDLGISLGN
ncbi:MAG: 6-phosphofructokinase [Chloroflexi bacterium HGW-Chloroflexi-10]|nr:MAG: 6-phosphofructokinase [Chloroflexi bacterium HGW-Chloroflexi-10]